MPERHYGRYEALRQLCAKMYFIQFYCYLFFFVHNNTTITFQNAIFKLEKGQKRL